MESRRRQRSFTLNHIPPLPISHQLEYPLGSRMHLVVVHPRLGARGRPFPRSPRSRSHVNLSVLRPLTRGPHSPPSPLWTPHGRPEVQGIFLPSRGQAPHAWLAHGSPLADDWFPNSTGLLLGAICPPSFPSSQPRNVPFPFATSRHPARPIPRVPCFPVLLGLLCGPCHTLCLVPSPFPIPHPVCIPHRPPETEWGDPTGSFSIRGPFGAPCTGCSYPAPLCLGGLIPTGPGGGPFYWPRPPFPSRYLCLYPTGPPASFVFSPPCCLLPCVTCLRLLFLSRAPIAPTRSPAASLLCAVRPPAVNCGSFSLVFVLF